MRVKIKDTWYDSNEVPICLHLHPIEKDQITAMKIENAPELKYAIVPAEWTKEQTWVWMEIEKEG
jgi:hypothetical protein